MYLKLWVKYRRSLWHITYRHYSVISAEVKIIQMLKYSRFLCHRVAYSTWEIITNTWFYMEDLHKEGEGRYGGHLFFCLFFKYINRLHTVPVSFICTSTSSHTNTCWQVFVIMYMDFEGITYDKNLQNTPTCNVMLTSRIAFLQVLRSADIG